MALYIILYILLSASGLLLLKKSLINDLAILNLSNIKNLLLNWYFIFGFLFYASSFLTWLYILSKKEISYAYPIVVGLSYFVIVLSSLIIFKESLTLNKIIGIVLIGIGIIFILR